MKEHKTIRLAYSAKFFIDRLVRERDAELKNEVNELTNEIENLIAENFFERLNGYSGNYTIKVTTSSIIEQAYRDTKNYSDEDWEVLKVKMEQVEYELQKKNVNIDNVTPRLFLDTDILNGLNNYCYEWAGAGRPLRLSYVIKLVVFGLYVEKGLLYN